MVGPKEWKMVGSMDGMLVEQTADVRVLIMVVMRDIQMEMISVVWLVEPMAACLAA